jgi:glycosyltransferase involved in cell wall biosynthesis
MALQASSSKMLANANVVNIPNPIGIDVYKKLDKADCKRKFNLPTNKKIILFGAAKVTDKRKGLSYLINSLKQLKATSTQDFLLVTFGRVVGFPELPFAHLPIEYLTDENAIVSLYNAADVFVVPSLEDNLPNTIMESLACGTPVVAFNTGGIPEMIDHKQNGYLAQLEDSADLAMGIQWILENQSYDLISEAAINKVKSNYTEENVADEYMKLYEKLLK